MNKTPRQRKAEVTQKLSSILTQLPTGFFKRNPLKDKINAVIDDSLGGNLLHRMLRNFPSF